MTQDNILKNYIANFDKVCKVSTIISQVCQIRGYDWLEETLLNKWAKTVLDYQKHEYHNEEVAFILAKYAFVKYMENDNLMDGDSIKAFLIDTINYV